MTKANVVDEIDHNLFVRSLLAMTPVKHSYAPGTIAYVEYENSKTKPSGIDFVCPCGCGNVGYLNLEPDSRPIWQLSGPMDSPTLTPSVHQTGLPCKWHGWLRDGVWKSV